MQIRNKDATCGTCPYWDYRGVPDTHLDTREARCSINAIIRNADLPRSGRNYHDWCGEHPDFEVEEELDDYDRKHYGRVARMVAEILLNARVDDVRILQRDTPELGEMRAKDTPF